MRNILFISTAIPPFPESQTIRNVFFLRGLAARGLHITVVTMKCSAENSFMAGMMPVCEIIYTKQSKYMHIMSNLSRKPFSKTLQWLYGIYANLFVIPDSHAGWDQIVIDHLEKNPLTTKPDIIISASGSYTAHMAAASLARKYNIPFIAELGDPWTYNPIWPATFFYRILRNKSIESRVIPECASLIVTTEETAKIYREWLGKRIRSIHVITMGYSKDEFIDVVPFQKSQIASITYIGVAYRSSRNLIPVIQGLTNVNKRVPLHFNVVGPHSSYFVTAVKKLGSTFVEFKGLVSYCESLKYIKNADVLVVIGNLGGVQVPGKIFMYLASGRPILYISQSNLMFDPAWKILKCFPGTTYCKMDPSDIEESLESIINDLPELGRLSFNRLSMPELTAYDWDTIGERFADVVIGLSNVKIELKQNRLALELVTMKD